MPNNAKLALSEKLVAAGAREELLKKYKSRLFEAYGIEEYATVPAPARDAFTYNGTEVQSP